MIRSHRKLTTLLLSSVVALSLLVTGCGNTAQTTPPANTGNTNEPVTIKVGATPVPHAEILEFIKPELAKQGVNLEVVIFTEYPLPNPAVDSGEIDANYFQHTPYLETFTIDQGLKLAVIGTVHIEPMGLYSKKITKAEELKDGDTIAIPNDPSNGGRALAVLESAGLLKLKEGVGVKATILDITENTKNLKFSEVDAAQLPRVLGDAKVAAAVINTNFALEGGLNPTEDALYLEGKDSPYANIVVAKEDRKDDPNLQKLVKALNTPEVKKFIEDKYKGSVIPAF
ncbi:MetQ/NlpA family ABC transporter substrate-binding protein [Desulfitobacterium sp. THU1]|uniref:MetQ/NlpA family ABC transporter substrate-binding protein n=1 Tax=Desulfitobacterium sp. THU1 TaxID=3138072 RepID=UPI00311F61D8